MNGMRANHSKSISVQSIEIEMPCLLLGITQAMCLTLQLVRVLILLYIVYLFARFFAIRFNKSCVAIGHVDLLQ